jgi:WD40 repeat protein
MSRKPFPLFGCGDGSQHSGHLGHRLCASSSWLGVHGNTIFCRHYHARTADSKPNRKRSNQDPATIYRYARTAHAEGHTQPTHGNCHTLSHGDEVMAVACSPDGTLLASGGYDNQIYLWGVPR